MPESEINRLDSPRNYKKRESSMNNWLNIIFKMMDDGHSHETTLLLRKQEKTTDIYLSHRKK